MTITIKRDLLEIALRYVSDPRLIEDECDGRKRNETNQDYADRISSSMQRNEDLREFIQELEDSLAAQPHDIDEVPVGEWCGPLPEDTK